MPKTKKVRKNKTSLKRKNIIKSSKNKTQKNLKGGLDPKIFSFIFLLFILTIKNIISGLNIKETIQSENINVFSEELKLENENEKVNLLSNNLSNLNEVKNEYKKFIDDPDQKALISYVRQEKFNLEQISHLPEINEKKIETSLSKVNVNNPTIDTLVDGFVDIYKSIFMSDITIDNASVGSFAKFILKLIDNKKIKELLNSYSTSSDKQLVTLNAKPNFIFLQKMFYVLNDYSIKINSENKTLLNKKYDEIIQFSKNNTYKQIYDKLNTSNVDFPSFVDDEFNDLYNIEKDNKNELLKRNLEELENMIKTNETDEINNKFKEIQNIFQNNTIIMNVLKNINDSYDDKIIKMNKIINFSVSLCTIFTNCETSMQIIMYILIVKMLIDLLTRTKPEIEPTSVSETESKPETISEPVEEPETISEPAEEPASELVEEDNDFNKLINDFDNEKIIDEEIFNNKNMNQEEINQLFDEYGKLFDEPITPIDEPDNGLKIEFPDVPEGINKIKKINKGEITPEQFKEMSEKMKLYFKLRENMRKRELLKNKLLEWFYKEEKNRTDDNKEKILKKNKMIDEQLQKEYNNFYIEFTKDNEGKEYFIDETKNSFFDNKLINGNEELKIKINKIKELKTLSDEKNKGEEYETIQQEINQINEEFKKLYEELKNESDNSSLKDNEKKLYIDILKNTNEELKKINEGIYYDYNKSLEFVQNIIKGMPKEYQFSNTNNKSTLGLIKN